MTRMSWLDEARSIIARVDASLPPTLWAMPGMPDEMVQRVKETW